jgi:hypothetical protein
MHGALDNLLCGGYEGLRLEKKIKTIVGANGAMIIGVQLTIAVILFFKTLSWFTGCLCSLFRMNGP